MAKQMLQQNTIKAPVSTVGIGVHTGDKVQLTLVPAPQNTGIIFIRTDLTNRPMIHADATHVSNTMLATSLTENDVTVSCVEHLMSAIWSAGIDNLYIEVSSEEIPIMDGSAAPFIYLIKQSGIQPLQAAKQFIKIKKSIKVDNGDASASLKPFQGFKASYTFVYDHPVYNRYPKYAELDFTKASFENEVSRARTFGLAKDLDQAQSMNKCLGSSLENAVGLDDYTILNKDGLRYEDEFVKHKLLDAVGDLYLLGKSILGEFAGYKSGHSTNNKLALALLAQPDAWELVSYESLPIAEQGNPLLQPLAA
ncbi:MAG: UDP-3-O-[3-hydroxymyristoyl] N-acetylglucosamine deacetylase [Candidatus Azotimanducaceae bacterium]|jgi:UDP-3-O-[3-hydroxymyristoyl] N-acetylglucosamine deacetylase